MATIGLDKLYYATVTEDSSTGYETFGTPAVLAKAISANISVEVNEATLYADDGAAEVVKEFKSGTISLNVDDIGSAMAATLLGATVDNAGVLVSSAEDNAPYVAIGFRARKSSGKYKYFWIYKVKFAVPNDELSTKGDSINFATPTIEGTILRRNKPDAFTKHPWKVSAVEGDSSVADSTITGWFSAVYEPSAPASSSTESDG